MVVVSGAVVGRILEAHPHPNADLLWVVQVDVGTAKLSIVHGGTRQLHPGDLVPVAPPGARLSTGKRMRTRKYRGQRSEGMLCSLVELGWAHCGPDAVHVLLWGCPGDPLRTGGTAVARSKHVTGGGHPQPHDGEHHAEPDRGPIDGSGASSSNAGGPDSGNRGGENTGN